MLNTIKWTNKCIMGASEGEKRERKNQRASLVVQWLGVRLPVQGARVRALVREDPTCRGVAEPVHHNY